MQVSRILLFGHDPILLHARRLILCREGREVTTSAEFPEAIRLLSEQPIDLLVLCHTAPSQEQRTLLSLAHTPPRQTRTLVLLAEESPVASITPDHALCILDRPRSLLSATNTLIAHAQPPQN